MALPPVFNAFGGITKGSQIGRGGLGLSGGGGQGNGSKGIRLGLAAFQLYNSLEAIGDFKAAAREQAAASRKIAREDNLAEVEQIELSHSRISSRIRAQASAGGFSGGSQSTLKIQNQQQSDANRLEVRSNVKLDRTLAEIQRRESAARKAARGMKTKAITGFVSNSLNILGG